MKSIYSFFFSFLFIGSAVAQSNIEELATSFANAYLQKDYELIIKLTHPDIIEKGGGLELAKSDLKANLDNPKANMLSYTSIEVGEPLGYFQSGSETQTFIPVKFFLELNEELYANTTHFFAVSKNQGQDWHFVNLEYYDQESLTIFIDNISEEMTIPENTPFKKLTKEDTGQ